MSKIKWLGDLFRNVIKERFEVHFEFRRSLDWNTEVLTAAPNIQSIVIKTMCHDTPNFLKMSWNARLLFGEKFLTAANPWKYSTPVKIPTQLWNLSSAHLRNQSQILSVKKLKNPPPISSSSSKSSSFNDY